jgi:hypothetical protein
MISTASFFDSLTDPAATLHIELKAVPRDPGIHRPMKVTPRQEICSPGARYFLWTPDADDDKKLFQPNKSRRKFPSMHACYTPASFEKIHW